MHKCYILGNPIRRLYRREVVIMDVTMSSTEVLQEIKKLNEKGTNLSKKQIKKANPELMRSALHYFPDWDSAIERSISG